MRQVVVYPGEDGYWVVEVPVWPAASVKGGQGRKRLSTSRKQSKDTSPLSKKTGCRSLTDLPVPTGRDQACSDGAG